MSTRARIDEFLSNKRLAIAGASRSGKSFGNTILRELRSKGYDVLPVHPEAERIDGVMFAEPAAWIHRAHRFLRGAFGRLPA